MHGHSGTGFAPVLLVGNPDVDRSPQRMENGVCGNNALPNMGHVAIPLQQAESAVETSCSTFRPTRLRRRKRWTTISLPIEYGKLMKGPSSGRIERILSVLPAAQRRVVKALIAGPEAKTYPAVAAELGVNIGTVHQHLRRIRIGYPDVYAVVMVVRRRQLAERHERSLARAREHDAWWFRQPASRRYASGF